MAQSQVHNDICSTTTYRPVLELRSVGMSLNKSLYVMCSIIEETRKGKSIVEMYFKWDVILHYTTHAVSFLHKMIFRIYGQSKRSTTYSFLCVFRSLHLHKSTATWSPLFNFSPAGSEREVAKMWGFVAQVPFQDLDLWNSAKSSKLETVVQCHLLVAVSVCQMSESLFSVEWLKWGSKLIRLEE